jgi:hypothetical protein
MPNPAVKILNTMLTVCVLFAVGNVAQAFQLARCEAIFRNDLRHTWQLSIQQKHDLGIVTSQLDQLIDTAPGDASSLGVRQTIQILNSTLLSRLAIPNQIHIELSNEAASYRDDTRVISIQSAPVSFLDRNSFETPLVHEYGHAIFAANFSRHSKIWADVMANNTGFRKSQFTSPAIYMVETLGLNRAKELSQAFMPLWIRSLAYQELFADLVAVAYLNNPSAIKTSPGGEAIESREFLGDAFTANWSNTDHHGLFEPTRKFLWARYFSKAKNQDNKAEMLATVYNTLAEEILQNPLNVSLSPDVANIRLLNSLSVSMKTFEVEDYK